MQGLVGMQLQYLYICQFAETTTFDILTCLTIGEYKNWVSNFGNFGLHTPCLLDRDFFNDIYERKKSRQG